MDGTYPVQVAWSVVAFEVTDWLSLAAGASIMYVDSVSESAIANLEPNARDGELRLELDGIDAGAIVAAMVEPWEGTRFGISYRNEQHPELEGMILLRRGNRLSIMPVSEEHWDLILGLE